MALKLYTYKENANAYKARIAAEFAGVSIEIPPFEMGVTNKTPEFLTWNPTGKVPVLVTPSGAIFESNAIARYIARLNDSGLYGSSVYESAAVDSWIDFASNELGTPLMQWGGPLFGFGPRVVEVEDKAKAGAARGLGALNTWLSTRTYVVGDAVTVADIILACALYYGFLGVLSPKYMADYPHVTRYFFTLVNKPQFKKVLGDVKQIDETPTDVLPIEKNPFAHLLRRPAPPAAEAKPKEAAPATPPQAGGEEEAAPKPKAKNPLDLLPPSPMVLDAWKRLYSNTKAKDFKEVAIKGFWEMYDPNGYSLWFCDYKHNDENSVKFITLNKVSGFLQRMDICRKYAFGKMCILGPDEGPFVIRGAWLFRGPEVPKFVMDEVYDMELYDWKKADIADEAQKNLISDMFEEPDEIEGVKLQEAKCFK